MTPNKLIRAVKIFREYETDIPTGTILCFMELMQSPGLTVSQVVARMGLSKQSASRNLRNLTHRARPGKDGIDVARTESDPQDYRIQCWYLNDRGLKLADRLKQIS